MIALVLLASILIALVSIFQYREEAKDYDQQRLDRKEKNVRAHINFIIKQTSYPVTTENLPLIFKDEIYKIADIHNLQINFYDLEGGLLKSSKATIAQDSSKTCLSAEVLNELSESPERRFVIRRFDGDKISQSSYSYITDHKFKPLAILNIPSIEEDVFLNRELGEFLERLSYAYLFMLVLAVVLAYFLSSYITKSFNAISEKMNQISLDRRNEKLDVSTVSSEISSLVNAYNSMVDQLEESASQLAKSEREQAWREMAKQVAHEIKNPLTPMRLSVQSFERKFDPQDPDIIKKVQEYSKTLIQQIDTMSSIASAFSNFAKMPAQQNEMLNVVEVVKIVLDIFTEDYISFQAEEEEIIAKFDRTQLIRVVTNLVKNATQAIPDDKQPRVEVSVFSQEQWVVITVKDNGIGISEENKYKIFEPKFTTKSSGMGLGLAMVKNIVETYQGNITFTSQLGVGTTFKVSFPKEES
ncbi:MAG: ATP-binding protein [Flavobacteriaceae bacterium]|nr:GHKL domain-containing protein [Mangrovimonas sp.]HRV53924.1 ATP-binding protein [Mangrovimonas sp.]